MKYTFAFFAPLATAGVLAFSPCSALAVSEFIPLQEFAQGQSLTGANLLNDSLYVNPAASAFTNVYSIDGTYELSKRYAVSVLDTKNGLVDGALGYFRQPVTKNDGGTYVEQMQGVKGALSGRISNEIAIGFAGKVLWGPRQNDGTHASQTDGDIGVLANVGPMQFGATVYNVLNSKTAVSELMDTHLGREFSVGARIGYQDLMFLSFATQSRFNEFVPYQYGFGAEYVSPYYFSLKGGYRFVNENSKNAADGSLLHGATHTSYWSAGVGINSPRVSVSYGVQFPQQASEQIEHVLGLMLLL